MDERLGEPLPAQVMCVRSEETRRTDRGTRIKILFVGGEKEGNRGSAREALKS